MKQTLKTTLYTYMDMTVYVIQDSKETNVYIETPDTPHLYFAFGVANDQADSINIDALHSNGYFDDIVGALEL